MIVAVTGGTGFIGRRVVQRHLEQGDEVRILTRKPADSVLGASVRRHVGDLTQETTDLVPFVDGADILYHCAGEIRDEARMERVHVEGTRHLIAAASGRIGRWVQLSSVGAYGPVRSGIVTEDSPLLPQGAYETTKTQADLLVQDASRDGAFACTVIRPSIVFGPDMPNQSMFQLISMISRGWFFFIGRPGASANYIFVDNVVDGMMLCSAKPEAAGRTYNLSDHLTLESFVGVIADALGRTAPRLRLDEALIRAVTRLTASIPGVPLNAARIDALTCRAVYPVQRIASELGYRHATSFEAALRLMVAKWRKRGN